MGLEYNFISKEKINETFVSRQLLAVKDWEYIDDTKFAFIDRSISPTNEWGEDFLVRIDSYVLYVCFHTMDLKFRIRVLDRLGGILSELNLSYELEEL